MGGNSIGAGTRKISNNAPTVRAPTPNEMTVAHKGLPTVPRKVEFTPVCTGSTAPANNASKKFITRNSKALAAWMDKA